jgi:hypothetical protein
MHLLVSVLFLWSIEATVLLLYFQYRAVRRHAATLSRDWLYQISVDRYRPMLRLLNEQDFRLLRNQPGFTPDMTQRVRLQRCQIFSQYLSALDADFQQVVRALKMLMARSTQDRPDLSRVLVRMQILFALGIVLVRVRLVLYRWGLASVDISPLIGMFDFVREKLRVLAPSGDAF